MPNMPWLCSTDEQPRRRPRHRSQRQHVPLLHQGPAHGREYPSHRSRRRRRAEYEPHLAGYREGSACARGVGWAKDFVRRFLTYILSSS